ncbi:hypothetical protein [Methylocystis iwaonis]|uniref:hypothetical protein n=1 Tax=Methylocystis iwaonis TaxID=2885079 RepID=UPI002E7BE2A4|nr:hypothetical protein [Methylocystis iwaonis]
MLIKSQNVATGDRRAGPVDQGLRPRHIVFIDCRQLGNALVDEQAGGLLDRRELAARDMRLEPCFLIARET